MLKRRGLLLVTLSLFMGLAAAWVANNWLQMRIMPAAEADENMTSVVVAALAIPYGAKVEARYVKLINMPDGTVPPGTFRDAGEVEGMVAMQAHVPGEILIKERFAAHDVGSTLAALVGESMRAVTVRVNDVVGVGGFLLPGNRVDVLAARKENRRAVTETILQDIKVLAVDQTASTDESKPVIVRAVTLEMTPKQAEALVKGREEGTIQLTLRNPLDDTIIIEEAPPVQKAATPRPRPVETTITVIRGTKVDSQKTKT
jgi:pilus assembly protein CpaB